MAQKGTFTETSMNAADKVCGVVSAVSAPTHRDRHYLLHCNATCSVYVAGVQTAFRMYEIRLIKLSELSSGPQMFRWLYHVLSERFWFRYRRFYLRTGSALCLGNILHPLYWGLWRKLLGILRFWVIGLFSLRDEYFVVVILSGVFLNMLINWNYPGLGNWNKIKFSALKLS